jgi:hypothetical protein
VAEIVGLGEAVERILRQLWNTRRDVTTDKRCTGSEGNLQSSMRSPNLHQPILQLDLFTLRQRTLPRALFNL